VGRRGVGPEEGVEVRRFLWAVPRNLGHIESCMSGDARSYLRARS